MSSADRSRWSGMVLAAAGVLLAVGAVMHPDESLEGAMAMPNWGPAHMLLFLSLIFAVLGFTGLYSRLSHSGWLGLGGYVLTIAGSLVFAGITFFEAWIAPAVVGLGAEGEALLAMDGPVFSGSLGTVFMVASVAFALGYLLLGIAVWQDGRLPKWAGIVLLAGGVLMPWSPPLPAIVFTGGAVLIGIAAAWLGWTMWSAGGNA